MSSVGRSDALKDENGSCGKADDLIFMQHQTLEIPFSADVILSTRELKPCTTHTYTSSLSGYWTTVITSLW